VLDLLGKVFAPVMGIFGLPGEAAFAFVAAFLLNLYAAIAVIAPLHLTPFQVTQCGLMMGVAHNLVVEGVVLSTTGARGGVLTVCRLVIACAAGLLLRGLWSLWETAASWAMPLPGLS
jgi:spore maturation protein SpmB